MNLLVEDYEPQFAADSMRQFLLADLVSEVTND
jgi:hypothetical protein